jgi:hypothetical protein
MYSGNRYFTLTEHRVPEAPTEIAERTAALADMYYQVFGEQAAGVHSDSEPRRPDDRDLALSALEGLSSSLAAGYADWLKVGMALHAVADDQSMLNAWDRWSRSCPDKYQPDACGQKWQSFDRSGGLGLASLIYWARQNGWEFPRAERRTESTAKADAPTLDRVDKVLAQGAQVLFRDSDLLEALARLAESDPAEFACVRAKVQKAKISLRDFDAALAPLRQNVRSQRPRSEAAGAYRIAGGASSISGSLAKDPSRYRCAISPPGSRRS